MRTELTTNAQVLRRVTIITAISVASSFAMTFLATQIFLGADPATTITASRIQIITLGLSIVAPLLICPIASYWSSRLLRELNIARRDLEVLAHTDQLTGLLNRRGFDGAAHAALEEARTASRPIAVMICDIDRFKKLNDSFGHGFGDECLMRISGVLRDFAASRKLIAGRQGGDEFVLMLARRGADRGGKDGRKHPPRLRRNRLERPSEPTPFREHRSGDEREGGRLAIRVDSSRRRRALRSETRRPQPGRQRPMSLKNGRAPPDRRLSSDHRLDDLAAAADRQFPIIRPRGGSFFEIAGGRNLLAVDGEDDVAFLDSDIGRRRPFRRFCDDDAFLLRRIERQFLDDRRRKIHHRCALKRRKRLYLDRVARRRFRRRGELQRQDDRFAGAQNAERGDAAKRSFAEAKTDAAAVVDQLAVDRRDDVAALQAGLLGRAAFRETRDKRADRPIEADRVGDILGNILQRRRRARAA